MTGDRRGLAREALSAALRVRQETKQNLLDPVCVYDLAAQMEVEVFFKDIPSLEGMYSKTPRTVIILGSERPASRRVYTCGHELGHHVFGHGTRVDELHMEGYSAPFLPEEFIAQAFAGFLLMPKLAVGHAFTCRGWKPMQASPGQIYRIANVFGVGYTTLIQHMTGVLGILTNAQSLTLLKVKLKEIRAALNPSASDRPLIVVDTQWKGRPVDAEMGDMILTPSHIQGEGDCLNPLGHVAEGNLFEARCPGQGRFHDPSGNWATFVRVSRHAYVGRSMYRHLEEVDSDE